MIDDQESVHVHFLDEEAVIETYRKKGYYLIDRSAPTIIAQSGFSKLTFGPEESKSIKVTPKPTLLGQVMKRMKG